METLPSPFPVFPGRVALPGRRNDHVTIRNNYVLSSVVGVPPWKGFSNDPCLLARDA